MHLRYRLLRSILEANKMTFTDFMQINIQNYLVERLLLKFEFVSELCYEVSFEACHFDRIVLRTSVVKILHIFENSLECCMFGR